MSLLLYLSLGILTILLVVVVCLWFVPFDVSVESEEKGGAHRRVFGLRWGLLGLNSVDVDGERQDQLLLFGRPLFHRTKKPGEKRRVKIEAASRALFKSLELREVSCHARVGLDNPAQTGMLFGYFKAFQGITTLMRDRISLSMEPVFEEPVVEGRLLSVLRINNPLRVLIHMVRLFFKKYFRILTRGVD